MRKMTTGGAAEAMRVRPRGVVFWPPAACSFLHEGSMDRGGVSFALPSGPAIRLWNFINIQGWDDSGLPKSTATSVLWPGWRSAANQRPFKVMLVDC